MKRLYIFDLDDTLVKSHAKVELFKDGKFVREISDYTNYKLGEDETFSFRQHRSAFNFMKTGVPMIENIKFMDDLKNDPENEIIILTGRAEFDNMSLFHQGLLSFGIDIWQIPVRLVGKDGVTNHSGDIASAKADIIRHLAQTSKYDVISLYDDGHKNLDHFLALSNDFKDIWFHAIWINDQGDMIQYG